jgi:hypothetical protein
LERNDGNKIYVIERVSSVDGILESGVELARGDDIFVSVSVSVDA